MKYFLSFCLCAIGASAFAQFSKPAPIRLQIRHADPWFIKGILEGLPMRQPEISTYPGFGGLGAATAQGAAKFFSNGKLVVNPTDNSLWFFPDS